jgi:Xaa-Pro dipeptidase
LNSTLFSSHLKLVQEKYESAIEFCASNLKLDGVLLHSGSEEYYFSDDRAIPFKAYSYYMQWVPINRPDQFVLISTSDEPKYFQFSPADYWHDQSITHEEWLESHIEIVRINAIEQIKGYIEGKTIGYLGPTPKLANFLGITKQSVNPGPLITYLNYKRAYKTEYEVAQLKVANKLAILGHQAAADCFLSHGNEYEIHMAYLNACGILEYDSPYTNIVATDEKCAILHYQHKRKGDGKRHKVLLLDAGCQINGYCSDVTRTSIKNNSPTIFKSLLAGMEGIELELISMIKPEVLYLDIHASAHKKIGQLLLDLSICSGSLENLIYSKIPHLFMPHGVGHLLGIQVHDVGGHQQTPLGAILNPPDDSPALRNTRLISKDMVFTIEPGCYFIPLLLEPERNTKKGKLINWQVIDQLYPYGGIRIEDNILTTEVGAKNLTREFE